MRVAVAVLNDSAPRLYGVESVAVLDVSELPDMAGTVDVVITDTAFDSAGFDPASVCVIGNTPDAEFFATQCGYACVSAPEVAGWFESVHGIDVTRKGGRAGAPNPTSSAMPFGSPGVSGDGDFKTLYASLVNELRKSGLYDSATLDNDNRLHMALVKQVRDAAVTESRLKSEIKTKDSSIAENDAVITSLRADLGSADGVRSALAESIVAEVEACCSRFEAIIGSIDALLDKPQAFYSAITKFAAARSYAGKVRAVYGVGDFKKLPALSKEFFEGLLAVSKDLADGALASIESLASGRERMDSVPEEISKLKGLVAAAKREAADAARKYDAVAATVASYDAELTARADAKAAVDAQLAQLQFDYKQLGAYTTEVEVKLSSANEVLVQYEQALYDKDAALAEYAASYGQANNYDSAEVAILQERIDALLLNLDDKDRELALLRSAQGMSPGSSGASDGVRDGVIRQLRQEVASYKRQLKEADDRAARKAEEAQNANIRADALNTSVKHLGRSVFAGGTVSALPPFEYHARGMILPVVGNSSCGITSAAVGLASALAVTAPTVVIDFDIISADMDSRFTPIQSPRVQIPAFGKEPVTAMSVFVERGVNALNTNYGALCRTISVFKGGRLDYLSGLYGKNDLTALIEAEYRDLFNFLGSEYAYIVVDCGKLGASEVGDQIIKNILCVASKTLIMSAGTAGKARSMRIKLQLALDSDYRRLASSFLWALVMHKGEDLSKFTMPSPSLSLPMIPSMVGSYRSYDADAASRREFKKVVAAMVGR